jgi:YD repeat-containing protein
VYDSGANTVGNLTAVTELDTSTMSYTYDALYRLTQEVRTGTGAYTKSYTYDLAGNVTQVNSNAFATYDNTNKIATLSGGTIAHDADGNVTYVQGAGIPSTWPSWHTGGMLTGGNYDYFYDHLKLRRARRTNYYGNPNRFYIFGGSRLIGEIDWGYVSAIYTWGANTLISQRQISYEVPTVRWYHYGPQGETRYLTDSTGAITDTYRYTSYGVPTYASGASVNEHRLCPFGERA